MFFCLFIKSIKTNLSYFFQIDYQFTSWGSPSQDLWFLIVTSIKENDRVLEFDNIISHYQAALEESLKVLGYNGKIPTLDDIHKDMLKRGILGKSMSLSIHYDNRC